jgi:hypothetical protein
LAALSRQDEAWRILQGASSCRVKVRLLVREIEPPQHVVQSAGTRKPVAAEGRGVMAAVANAAAPVGPGAHGTGSEQAHEAHAGNAAEDDVSLVQGALLDKVCDPGDGPW